MKKISFLLGAGVGFVLGSKAGRRPSEQLEAKLRAVTERPEVRNTVERVRGVAKERAGSAVEKLQEKLPGSHADTETRSESAPIVHELSDADQQDLEFGKAAAEKEERLDAMLEQGLQPVDGATEEAQLDKGELKIPQNADQERLAHGTADRQ